MSKDAKNGADKKTGVLDRYKGDKQGDFRHGLGNYTYNNSAQYQGTWVAGKKEGQGSLTLKDGTIIQGDFQKGEINGVGMKVWPGGKQTYKGSFHKGHMDGHGEMQYADGSTYTGQFAANKRHGIGTLVDEFGIYNGEFFENRREGNGTQIYDGEKYKSAACYAGEWKDNVFHGKGKFSVDGFVMDSLFEKGKPVQIPTKLKIEINSSNNFNIVRAHPFDARISIADQNGDPVKGTSGFKISFSCWYSLEKLENFIAMKAQSPGYVEPVSKLQAMPSREFPTRSVVFPIANFKKFVNSCDLTEWNTSQEPDDPLSERLLKWIRNSEQSSHNFFQDFANMIYDYDIPISGSVVLPEVCLPGDTKETYPPLILANLKKEYDEALKRDENKKTRVVYFGERPPDVKFDSLGQPIFMASTVDSSKNTKNTKHPIAKVLNKQYAPLGEYLLVAKDESASKFYEWFDIPPLKQTIVKLHVVAPSPKTESPTQEES